MKKYYFIMLIIIFLLTSTLVVSKNSDKSLKGLKIILDAGHGGKDGGTSVGRIFEKDINLSIVLKLRDKLNKHGVDVLLTRDNDYDLSSPNASRRKKSDFDNRIKYINNSDADLYLSIHINYLEDTRYYGAQTFYVGDNKDLADIIQNEFKINLGSSLSSRKLDNSIYMYKQLDIPGVLIECGFLSNKMERDLLVKDDYQSKVVDAIYKALVKYY